LNKEEIILARAERLAELRATAQAASSPALAAVGLLGFATWPELHTLVAPDANERALATLVHAVEAALATGEAFEINLWPHELRVVPRELIQYFYNARGDRHPKRDFRRQADSGQLSPLAAAVFEAMLHAPQTPVSAEILRDRLGAERTSVLGIERSLAELAKTLKVSRVGRAPSGERWFQPTVALLPTLATSTSQLSHGEAAAALITVRLRATVCDTEEDLTEFFAPIFTRAKIHEALTALDAARCLAQVTLDGRKAFRLP
jgi:uncharacterized protein YcaQ